MKAAGVGGWMNAKQMEGALNLIVNGSRLIKKDSLSCPLIR